MISKQKKNLIIVIAMLVNALFISCDQNRIWFNVTNHSNEWVVHVNDDLIVSASYRVYSGDIITFESNSLVIEKTIKDDLAEPYTTVTEDFIIYAY